MAQVKLDTGYNIEVEFVLAPFYKRLFAWFIDLLVLWLYVYAVSSLLKISSLFIFTDPWTIQPQPKCGFVVAGNEGTVSTYDYDNYVTLQTRKKKEPHKVAAPATRPPYQNPVQYLIYCLEKDLPLEGPVSLEISRIGQEIVDAAVRSAKLKRTVRLE